MKRWKISIWDEKSESDHGMKRWKDEKRTPDHEMEKMKRWKTDTWPQDEKMKKHTPDEEKTTLLDEKMKDEK